jgi:ABC-type branched-subunit amino acid transport system ATPase component
MHISENDILLKVTSLCTGYGKRQVLFDVSFEIKRREIVLLVGGNGSGKSTILKAIYGLLNDFKDRKGRVIFESQDITEYNSFRMIEKGLVYVPQKNNTFEHLSVKENLEVAASYLKDKKELKMRIEGVFEKLPQLIELRSRTPFHLSGGEVQQLALGMALIQRPKMILLDEPSAGLTPNAWQKNVKTIQALNQQGITFLIVEHMIKEIIHTTHNTLKVKLGRIENVGTKLLEL